jgi:molybdopterin molybdotransferase
MVERAPSCDDDFDAQSLTCEEALRRILAAVEIVDGCEQVPVRNALGRILAAPLDSPFDVPAHTNSAMDGYALATGDLPASGTVTLKLIGTAFAGRPFNGRLGRGDAVRIMTGAVLPEGADLVVMQEHAIATADHVTLDGSHKRGQNVRAAGEDLQRGQRVLDPGRRLTPADLGVIASLGIGEVRVRRRVRVAYFSTGDELRSLGEQLGPGEIFDSNRYTLHAMLTRQDTEIVDLGVVRDRRADVECAFRDAAARADVVISSGGVSVGEADYIKEVLGAIGEVRFWKVAMKPGRPLAFGNLGAARFFGLPGNPVSVMVTFYQFVRPALVKMSGAAEDVTRALQARTAARLKKRPGRFEFQRGILREAADGVLEVTPTGDQGSGILYSMSKADCFILLDMESSGAEAGAMVTVQPFQGLI